MGERGKGEEQKFKSSQVLVTQFSFKIICKVPAGESGSLVKDIRHKK